MKRILIVWFFSSSLFAQESGVKEFTFNEYLGYVKKFHPMVKSANLHINSAQANLMMARGGFDPKIEVDFDKKQFKDKAYYSILNSSFKIPTWYGIEVKAGFDHNEGIFLNPENMLPNNGLTSLGVTVPLGQGMLINQRMADLRKAKLQIQLSQAERKLLAIQVLYDASVAYFNWKRYYNEVKLYESYLTNASTRYNGIKSLIKNGDKPAIDSVEARITLRNRQLSLEDSKLKLIKSKLELANFLWLENDIPVELQENMVPEESLELTIKENLKIDAALLSNPSLATHPKINALQSKMDILNVERKLKSNALLPKINVGYYYLSEPNYLSSTHFSNYKIGMNFYFPIFLRKERGSLKLAEFKIQGAQFDLDLEFLQLENKIKAQQSEIKSLDKQRLLIDNLVFDYNIMLSSEERLFSVGESAIFFINSRENSLISSQLSKIALDNRFLISCAELFKMMSDPD